ncbi:MAG TPA: hypothetical protein DCZ80_06365 [Legionellales bacterium]|nr:hypothetical protein [Legionellales bacterium]
MCLWMKKLKEKRLIKKIKSLVMQRKLNQVSDKQLQEELKLYHELATLYGKLVGKHKAYPYALEMQVSAYRNAATLEDPVAYFWLGQEFLKHAKACEEWQNNEVLASELNQQQKDFYYSQSYRYLELASVTNTEALRVMGLCHIHGWGVAVDRQKGFSLIVDSINRDNSWDKLPEIFSKIGLNKPEFLSELIRYRTTGGTSSTN